MIKNKISRNDVIIAIGGGVVGDLAGFAAATYLVITLAIAAFARRLERRLAESD